MYKEFFLETLTLLNQRVRGNIKALQGATGRPSVCIKQLGQKPSKFCAERLHLNFGVSVAHRQIWTFTTACSVFLDLPSAFRLTSSRAVFAAAYTTLVLLKTVRSTNEARALETG